jgi:hypothetical protein
VEPRAGLYDWRSENSLSYWDSNSDLSIIQPVATRYSDYTIPAPKSYSVPSGNSTSNEVITSSFNIHSNHYSLITLQLDALESSLLTVFLDKR